MAQAITQANRAAALMVTRHGTADVIPDLKEVQAARFDLGTDKGCVALPQSCFTRASRPQALR